MYMESLSALRSLSLSGFILLQFVNHLCIHHGNLYMRLVNLAD